MLRYVHAFRGLAIALVVVSHAKLVVGWSDPLTPSEAVLKALIEGADIPFWFIAGFLFQHMSGRFNYGPYLWARARNVGWMSRILRALPSIWASAAKRLNHPHKSVRILSPIKLDIVTLLSYTG
jgi:peptidoglycan/LPS O-acetylase OafA/YrhL